MARIRIGIVAPDKLCVREYEEASVNIWARSVPSTSRPSFVQHSSYSYYISIPTFHCLCDTGNLKWIEGRGKCLETCASDSGMIGPISSGNHIYAPSLLSEQLFFICKLEYGNDILAGLQVSGWDGGHCTVLTGQNNAISSVHYNSSCLCQGRA